MTSLLKDKRGSMPILFLGLVFVMLLMTMLIIEMGGAYQNYFVAESVLQRSANSAVEKNLDDSYKADHILKLKTVQAKTDFEAFATSDLDQKYHLTIDSITAEETPPTLTATGTISFPTVFSKYGFRDVTFRFEVQAQNVRLTE